MIRSRLPKRIVSLHSLITDQNILHGVVQCMSHMKLPGNIWGRDHNGKGRFGMIHLGMKILLIQPFLINTIFDPFGIIGLCKFLLHTNLL